MAPSEQNGKRHDLAPGVLVLEWVMSDNSTGWKCKQALCGRDEIGRGTGSFLELN